LRLPRRSPRAVMFHNEPQRRYLRSEERARAIESETDGLEPIVARALWNWRENLQQILGVTDRR
jgi:hypothetical protein